MRYPHVAGLWFSLESAPTRSFSNPPPVERHTERFYLRLEDGIVTVWMKEHHATVNSARQVVEEYLRRWELSAALEYQGRPDIRFEFKRADVVDLDPPPPGALQGTLAAAGTLTARLMPITAVSKDPCYPRPPDGFRASPEVEVLWSMYNLYREQRYPLLPMTYAFVTFFEAHAGGRPKAKQRYNVSDNVFGKLRNLSSETGIGAEARKFEPGKDRHPLTNEDRQWIENALRALIWRVGEVAHDADKERPKITRNFLPS